MDDRAIGASLHIPVEDVPHHRSSLRIRRQPKPLVLGQLHSAIAVGRCVAHPFAFLHRRQSATLQAAVDDLVLPPCHKEAELEVFLIELVVGVVGFQGGDDLGVGDLERLGDDALVDGVTTGETLHFHHQHPLPQPLIHVRQQLLHLGTGGDGVAGDHFFVDVGHVQLLRRRQRQQGLPVPGQGVAFAVGFRFQIDAALSEIDCIGHGSSSLL